MTVRILPSPAGGHSRRGSDALVDAVRHGLLRLLVGTLDPDHDNDLGPIRRGMTQGQVRRREWHAIACAVGDAIGEIASYLAVVVACGLVLGAVAAIVVVAPGWVSLAVAGTGLAVVVVWRIGVAGRRLPSMVEETENEENEA